MNKDIIVIKIEKIDRDWNASINIKKFALQKQNLIAYAPKELREVPLETPTGVGSAKEEANEFIRW